ncbi:UPF0769 protein C21orf59 homolog [Phalaenopsis equestris]|uniref:UPF0769 protein C21orf59 homolog n=1 Tax=Phalaenopsis equestris TaxID=78828 RepID=UPI0009E5F109|nr:UPF0769 protein C21orf59 homolog [Phalaenopsis equestris]XP_020583386.1 UPF0769 protein C21orf59 homolog [Phalaenopsis equestris]XP_020583387.1 UPF0769 protein C21orf59 homolog [Phalaenopsis equestris]XP_020583389.1 UPF0769 protein C21orf59 homolog [Phalaenopsis equestris]
MVRIEVKGATAEEEHQFLYNCPCESSIADIADAIVEIYNLQTWIRALCIHVRQHLLTDAFRESCPAAAVVLDRTLSEAESYASKEQVLHQRLLSPYFLRDHIQNIEREVKLAHSSGLAESMTQLTTFNPELHQDVQLIWAGKELSRGKKLCEYIGENEKTKITIKLKFGC